MSGDWAWIAAKLQVVSITGLSFTLYIGLRDLSCIFTLGPCVQREMPLMLMAEVQEKKRKQVMPFKAWSWKWHRATPAHIPFLAIFMKTHETTTHINKENVASIPGGFQVPCPKYLLSQYNSLTIHFYF